MSGLELIGIAASIFQIADLGAQLSIKLCTFCHKVKNADQNIRTLSNDVALTSTVLRHLGDNLEQDQQVELYSNGALNTAHEVLQECRKVFQQIGSAIDDPGQDSAKSLFQRAAKRVGFVIIEPRLDALRSNLERLKSTMLLMLNVIMYAGQIRGRLESKVLQEQRELIERLMEEKQRNERRFRQLTNALESSSISDDETLTEEREPSMCSTSVNTMSSPESFRSKELRVYCDLIAKMLSDIDACKSDLESARHLRISTSIFNMNSVELGYFDFTHGRMAADFIRTRLPRLYDRTYPMPTADAWRHASDIQGTNGGGLFGYRQSQTSYSSAMPGQNTASDDKDSIPLFGKAPAAFEPMALDSVEPNNEPYLRQRIDETGREYSPESPKPAQGTHQAFPLFGQPAPLLKRSHEERNRKKDGEPAKRRRSKYPNDSLAGGHPSPSQNTVSRDEFEGQINYPCPYDPSSSKLTYADGFRHSGLFGSPVARQTAPSFNEVQSEGSTMSEAQDSPAARSPMPTREGVSSEPSGEEYVDEINLKAKRGRAKPDGKSQDSNIDLLLLEWTILGKEEISSTRDAVVTAY